MKLLLQYVVAASLAGVVQINGFAHSYGPPPGVTGAPGDDAKACTLCHSGTLNSGSGSVKIVLQSGQAYVPGVKQRVIVQVADPNQQRWGFELSARLNSDLQAGQAGDFTPIDNFTQVVCADFGPKPCSSGPSFIEHTSAGTRRGTTGGAAFQFDWTPPATNMGPVTFFVAGNAANGNAATTGDFIYTSSVQLNPAIAAAPVVISGNVVSAATQLAGPTPPNSWVTIYGTNLSATTRSWTDGDFLNGGIPFSLDGVSVLVTLFGSPRLAYVGYVSPTQVNFLLPSDIAATSAQVQVRNPAGLSSLVPITLQANAPQLLTLDGAHVSGTHANGTVLGKAAPAVKGETVAIYGTGLGATTPAQVPGQVPVQPAALTTPPQVTIGGTVATVVSAGILTGSAGVYQINVQIPAGLPGGDVPIVVQVGGVSSAST